MKQQTNHNPTGLLVLILCLLGDIAEIIIKIRIMNIDNLQTLNSEELVETNGGSIALFLIGVGIGVIIGIGETQGWWEVSLR